MPFPTPLVCHCKLFIVPVVTSSLQGPPNYGTYAGLHSNQILTVKVCSSKRTVAKSSQQPALSVRLLISCYRCRQMGQTPSLSFLFRLPASKTAELSSVFSHSSYFPLGWILICSLLINDWFLVSVLIYPFLFPILFVLQHAPCPTLSLSLFPLFPFSPEFLLLVPAAPLASQMVFPRYDHGFLSGEQSGSFQRRFLKVHHNLCMCALWTL